MVQLPLTLQLGKITWNVCKCYSVVLTSMNPTKKSISRAPLMARMKTLKKTQTFPIVAPFMHC